MKKIIFLILLLFVFKAEAQKSVTFKMKYLPNHNYQAAVNMDIKCNITISGDEQVIEKLKSQGMTQPISLNMNMKMNGDTKTGVAGANNTFPLAMTFKLDQIEGTLNGNPIPIPGNVSSKVTRLYGHVGQDGKLKADSISGGTMKDTSEQKISQLMNSIQKKIQFPDHPMHIGDTFTQEMPFNIPLGGNNMNATAKAVYKLVKIADGNAYFDIQQSMDMSIPVKNEIVTLKGDGNGKMVFSLKDSFPTDFTSNINLKFNGKITTVQVDGTAAISMEYKYTIN